MFVWSVWFAWFIWFASYVWLVSLREPEEPDKPDRRDRPFCGLVGVTRQVRAIRAAARPATNEKKANEQGHFKRTPATYSIVTPFIREIGRIQQMRNQKKRDAEATGLPTGADSRDFVLLQSPPRPYCSPTEKGPRPIRDVAPE